MKKEQFGLNVDKFLEIEPPAHLKEAIFRRIELERRKKALRHKIFYFCGFFVSGGGFLLAGIFFVREIRASEFWSILSLIFTDAKILTAYWREYALSLMETFPFEATIFVLAPVLILLVLMKKYVEYIEQHNLTKLKLLKFN